MFEQDLLCTYVVQKVKFGDFSTSTILYRQVYPDFELKYQFDIYISERAVSRYFSDALETFGFNIFVPLAIG